MANYFSPGLNKRWMFLKMNSRIWKLGDNMYTRGVMRGCGEAQGGLRVPVCSTCSLCPYKSTAQVGFSPQLFQKASVILLQMKIFLAVGSSLANTPCSSFFVSPICFFSSLILDSTWSAVAGRVGCVPVIWSSLTTTTFNFLFQSDVLCPLPIYHITFLLFLLL